MRLPAHSLQAASLGSKRVLAQGAPFWTGENPAMMHGKASMEHPIP